MKDRSNNYPIIVDAMGGDFAPLEIIRGALEAVSRHSAEIKLVGDVNSIQEAADSGGFDISDLEISPSTQQVGMDESPSDVLKNKKGSSIYIGSQLVGQGNGSAFLSAGNTGAVMACSLFNIKRIKGVFRPAIAAAVPLGDSRFVLIDVGANADCKPIYLAQFALMGKVYSESILGVKDPKVGIVNIGEEEKKGNELTVDAHKILKDINGLNFVGNIEGREMFEGIADVVVTDGFTGNVILKVFEGLAKMFFGEIRSALSSSFISKMAALILKKPLKGMKNKFDYETYGGAQLLGLNAPVIISHGSSKARAVRNAIRVGQESL
ncbi:MAG: phosphate acyltransferase PlsX, partial [Candidatus Humimicrobiaceae bacterium]